MFGVSSRSVIIAIITISCIVFGGRVSARLLVLDKPPLIEKTQAYIRKQVKKQGIPFLQKTYQQFDAKQKESKNPLVRLQLNNLKKWMKQEYALSDTERTTTPIRKEQVFLMKDGKKIVRRGKSMGIHKAKISPSTKSHLPRVPKNVSQKGYKSSSKEHFVAPGKVVASKKNVQQPSKKLLPQKNEHASSPSLVKSVKDSSVSQSIKDNSVSERYTLKNGRINITTLRKTWIGWVNGFRAQEGVSGKITYSPRLSKTATERSYKMRSDGHRSHRRTPQSPFYSYKEIEQWFAQRGIVFKNVHRATFTENVGQGYLSCRKGDCTQDALRSLRNTFNYFIGEKNQPYKAHYQTIVKPEFTIMGFGIAVDEKTNTFYSTMHYATAIK